MADNCKQTDIPEVDNSAIPCEDFYNALCVMVETTFPFISITSDDKNLVEVLDAIVNKLKTQSTLITTVKNTLDLVEGISYTVQQRDSDYIALVSDNLITLDGANLTMFASADAVYPLTIKNIGTTAQTITPVGTDTVAGEAVYTINPQESITIFPIAGNFEIITGSSSALRGTSYLYVNPDGTAAQNAAKLTIAYTIAKAMTPYGAALATDNRVKIILGAGTYTFGSPFNVDTQYIDFTSLTGDPDVILDGINVTANDVSIKGISTGTAAFTVATLLASLKLENCKGGDNSFVSAGDAAGTFINCAAGAGSFGTTDASGTFINCEAGSQSFGETDASGIFENCRGTFSCFGWSGDATGTFKYCTTTGGTSFGYGGDAAGFFIGCISEGGDSFGGTDASGEFHDCYSIFGYSFSAYGDSSGSFYNCSVGQTGGFGDSGDASGNFYNCYTKSAGFGNIASGNFYNCTAESNSFGFTTASGNFYHCVANTGSFGKTASGKFQYCVASSNSFGNVTALTGQCYFCRITSGAWQTVSGAGRTVYCIDGSDNTNNQ